MIFLCAHLECMKCTEAYIFFFVILHENGGSTKLNDEMQ
jgi:hypothetical protein